MSNSTNPPLIDIRGVHKAFGGVRAVENANLNVYPGEVVALLGHNGAGKSTLMKMLAGAYPIDSGEVRVAGELATDADLARIDRVGTRQHLHQCRLAGAVVAQQGHHFTGVDVDADVFDRVHTAEGLVHAADVNEWCRIVLAHDMRSPVARR